MADVVTATAKTVFEVTVIYFERTPGFGMLWPGGAFAEHGGQWRCAACRMVIPHEETPWQHAAKVHPVANVGSCEFRVGS